jgi:hypothetical protein
MRSILSVCAAALAALPLLALGGPGHTIPPAARCAPMRGVVAIAFPSAAPPGLVRAFNAEFRPYALPGGRFNIGDLRRGNLPNRRLVWARRAGSRYVVAFEQGGYAPTLRAVAYDMGRGGRMQRADEVRTAMSGGFCGAVAGLLRAP